MDQDRAKSITSFVEHRRRYLSVLMLIVVNVLLFASTAPLNSSSLLVVVGFLLAALDIWLCTYLLVSLFSLLLPQIARHKRRLSLTIASFSIVALALASLGQLTWRDTLVVAIIWVIGYLYTLRFNLKAKPGT